MCLKVARSARPGVADHNMNIDCIRFTPSFYQLRVKAFTCKLACQSDNRLYIVHEFAAVFKG